MSRETNYLINIGNSKKKPDETMAILHDDDLTNIFSWLPAKQVAQLRCLSKPFNARLSDPVFLKSNVDHAVNLNDKPTFLVFRSKFSFKNHQPFKVINFQNPHLELMNNNVIKLPANVDATCSVIGSIDGLICFYYHQDPSFVIHIWNPYIPKLLVLPQSTNIPQATWSYHLFLSFGFDPKTNDYKVLTLRFRAGPPSWAGGLEENPTVPKECLLVEVYSMRKGSWKVITDKFPSHVTRIYHEEEVCVHGHHDHVHWLGDHGEYRTRQTIVAFDFGGETFCEISLPYSIQVSIKDRAISLGYMDGKICLMSHISDADYEIWVMDRYGMSQSWVKHTVNSHFSGVINPSGEFMNAEFMYKAYGNSLALYDPVATKDHKPLKIMGIHVGNTKVVRHVESLIWVSPPAYEVLDHQHLLTEV